MSRRFVAQRQGGHICKKVIFNRYVTEPYLIIPGVNGDGGYYTFVLKNEYLDLDEYLKGILNVEQMDLLSGVIIN